MRMYHPNLGREIEALDEAQAAVYREAGWVDAPEPEIRPGYAPEPVKYAPVTVESEPAKKISSRGKTD